MSHLALLILGGRLVLLVLLDAELFEHLGVDLVVGLRVFVQPELARRLGRLGGCRQTGHSGSARRRWGQQQRADPLWCGLVWTEQVFSVGPRSRWSPPSETCRSPSRLNNKQTKPAKSRGDRGHFALPSTSGPCCWVGRLTGNPDRHGAGDDAARVGPLGDRSLELDLQGESQRLTAPIPTEKNPCCSCELTRERLVSGASNFTLESASTASMSETEVVPWRSDLSLTRTVTCRLAARPATHGAAVSRRRWKRTTRLASVGNSREGGSRAGARGAVLQGLCTRLSAGALTAVGSRRW